MRILLLLLAVLLLGPAARAAESAPVASKRAVATLISDTDAVAAGKPFRVALRLRLAPGWHTYWKNPGDAGAAPDISWKLSAGARASDIAWPAPARQAEGPLMTYGYSGEVVLPVQISGAGANGADVTADAQWLVCNNICVPESGTFSLHLPPGVPAPSPQAGLFRAADSRIPRPSPWPARIGPDGTLDIAGAELTPATVTSAAFVPDETGLIADAAPQRLVVENGHLQLRLQTASGEKPLAGLLLITDATGLASSYAITATPAPELHAPVGLMRVLLLAFAGGVILNLMPCVFPVLAIKAMGLARLSQADRVAARAHALSYTAGILLTFAGLGGLMLALRAGWGFQFQSPLFVGVMAAVLFAVGLNLAGAFELIVPASIGSRLAGRGGHVGSFFTGLLAVLVATPCTAPFMAVAIGAALVLPPATALGVFLALGLGLAAPYLVLATVPALTRLLPRPGRWMLVLRRVLAVPMFAAAIWLVWVLGQGFSGAAMARTPGTEAFSAARLAALQAEGRPVFVDMTAAWCVTCLVNERVALDPAAVRAAFAARHVVYLKGDWTRQDPEITAFLRAHARDGVPLYVFYPGGGKAAEILPQILTQGTVLGALTDMPS